MLSSGGNETTKEFLTVLFYKYASPTQNLILATECFIKMDASVRKYRRLLISQIALYIMSGTKLRYKITFIEIRKLYSAKLSSEMYFKTKYNKQVLIDDLANRQFIKKTILEGNQQIVVKEINCTILNQCFTEREQEIDQRNLEADELLNLRLLKQEYKSQRNDFKVRKTFRQLYMSKELLLKSECFTLSLAISLKESQMITGKKVDTCYTVKSYAKELMWNNEQVLNDAIRERENLEEITSPYVPILVSCLYDDTKFYIVTEGYKGCTLRQYLAREGSIKKTNLKCLLSQIVIAIGQVHECNRSYNEVNLDGIFVLVDGYILLNKFTNCCQLMSATRATTLIQYQSPEELLGELCTTSWDWWSLANLIYEIKEKKSYNHGRSRQQLQTLYSNSEPMFLEHLKWKQQPQLLLLLRMLFAKRKEDRLGSKSDYHEIINHEYFKGVNKKQLMQRRLEKPSCKHVLNLEKYESEDEQEGNFEELDVRLNKCLYSRDLDDQ